LAIQWRREAQKTCRRHIFKFKTLEKLASRRATPKPSPPRALTLGDVVVVSAS
jgi:hypothetical protein